MGFRQNIQGIRGGIFGKLGGGFKDSFFSPLLGEDFQFDEWYFLDGLVQPLTSKRWVLYMQNFTPQKHPRCNCFKILFGFLDTPDLKTGFFSTWHFFEKGSSFKMTNSFFIKFDHLQTGSPFDDL